MIINNGDLVICTTPVFISCSVTLPTSIHIQCISNLHCLFSWHANHTSLIYNNHNIIFPVILFQSWLTKPDRYGTSVHEEDYVLSHYKLSTCAKVATYVYVYVCMFIDHACS